MAMIFSFDCFKWFSVQCFAFNYLLLYVSARQREISCQCEKKWQIFSALCTLTLWQSYLSRHVKAGFKKEMAISQWVNGSDLWRQWVVVVRCGGGLGGGDLLWWWIVVSVIRGVGGGGGAGAGGERSSRDFSSWTWYALSLSPASVACSNMFKHNESKTATKLILELGNLYKHQQ